MHAFTGVALAAALLLAAAAAPKVTEPAPTITALRSVGLVWVGRRLVRLLTVIELAVGIGAVVVGGRVLDAAVALLYLGFSGFLVLALRSPGSSCGCTARDDTPPTIGHLLMTAAFAAGTTVVAVTGGRTGLVSLSRHGHSAELAAAAGFALLVAWLGWAILTLPVALNRPSPEH